MRAMRVSALLVVLALLLAACAGDDGDQQAPDDEGVDTGEYPDLSGESFEVTAAWTGGEEERFREVLDGFEDATGASVDYSAHGDEPTAVLGPRVQGGDPPTVSLIAQPGVIRDFQEQGALVPLDQEASEQVEDNFDESWAELGTFDDELYGVYFKVANKSLMWFNTGLFEDAGVEPPETWEELLDSGEQLSAFGVPAFSLGGGDGWTLTDWFENVYLRTAGPEMYDQLTDHEIAWTDESVTEALSVLGEAWGDDQLLADRPLETSFPDSVSRVFTDPADAAIVFEGDFVAGTIEDETEATVGQEADFFDFPEIEDSGPALVTAGDQAVLFEDSEGGQALMRYLASAEAAETWAAEGGFLSANQGVELDTYPDEPTQRMAESIVETEAVRFDMSDLQPPEFGGTPGQGMWKILQDFLGDPSDVEGTAQELEDAAAQAHE